MNIGRWTRLAVLVLAVMFGMFVGQVIGVGWLKDADNWEHTGEHRFAAQAPVTIAGTLTVSGPATHSGTVTMSGATTISGAATLSGGATLSGANTLSGTTTISGTATLSGASSQDVLKEYTIASAVSVTNSGSYQPAGGIIVRWNSRGKVSGHTNTVTMLSLPPSKAGTVFVLTNTGTNDLAIAQSGTWIGPALHLDQHESTLVVAPASNTFYSIFQ